MKNTFKVAFCGIVSALALVIMMMSSVFSMEIACPCFAGMVLMLVAVELGYKWGIASYVTVSLLSLVLVPNKEGVLYFVGIFGFYPIVKFLLEKIKPKWLGYSVKLLLYNACLIIVFFVAKLILLIPDDEFKLFGVYLPWVFLILGNILFVVYDKCITVMLKTYFLKIRDRIIRTKNR